MLATFVPWLADALVLLGLTVLTISIWGVLRMPDLYTRLHAASKGAALGVAPLLLAAGLENRTIMLRGLLVLGFLLLTSPVSSHVIARAFWRTEPESVAPSATDPRPATRLEPVSDPSDAPPLK